MAQRSLEEVLKDIDNTPEYNRKRLRELHREVKKIDDWYGVPIYLRYPYLPYIVSCPMIAIAILIKILR